MFKMFKQLFAALEVLFGAAEKGARALDHLATWSEETAGSFSDEARVERQKKALALKASLAQQNATSNAQIAAANAGTPAP